MSRERIAGAIMKAHILGNVTLADVGHETRQGYLRQADAVLDELEAVVLSDKVVKSAYKRQQEFLTNALRNNTSFTYSEVIREELTAVMKELRK